MERNVSLQCEGRDETYGDNEERRGRFVETTDTPEILKSKSMNKLKPFYAGVDLDKRMAAIRESIYYIRCHWDEYETFIQGLKQLLLEQDESEFKDEKTRADLDVLLSSKRDWLSADTAATTEPRYEAVKLYTSKEGHARMYKLSNRIFRDDSDISIEIIRSMVFLVELINIDLFNYCIKVPERKNFEGEVYRGICLSEEDLTLFKAIKQEPLGSRNIAVPLGLLSASYSLAVAQRFIEQQLKQDEKMGAKTFPVLIKTHVIGLPQEYVDHYTHRFPSAVLTTICAVDVHKLSRFPKEKEVLLRGPFMLVLDIYQDDSLTIRGQPCHVVEAVMLNANRDHISTSFLGDQDALARDLFATMVTVTRSQFAMKYCEEKGLTTDEESYRNLLGESKSKLQKLMKNLANNLRR